MSSSYQSNAIGFGRRVDAYEYEIGFFNAFVNVCSEVKVSATTFLDYFLKSWLKVDSFYDKYFFYKGREE